jgi:hypothetical protein
MTDRVCKSLRQIARLAFVLHAARHQLLRDPASELVFGLVAPVGADLDMLENALSNQLQQYGYTPNRIRLSKLLKGVDLKDDSEFARLTSYMDGGNQVRESSGSGEILALWRDGLHQEWSQEGNPSTSTDRPHPAINQAS